MEQAACSMPSRSSSLVGEAGAGRRARPGAAAHELNQPLTSIHSGRGGMIQRQGPHPTRPYLRPVSRDPVRGRAGWPAIVKADRPDHQVRDRRLRSARGAGCSISTAAGRPKSDPAIAIAEEDHRRVPRAPPGRRPGPLSQARADPRRPARPRRSRGTRASELSRRRPPRPRSPRCASWRPKLGTAQPPSRCWSTAPARHPGTRLLPRSAPVAWRGCSDGGAPARPARGYVRRRPAAARPAAGRADHHPPRPSSRPRPAQGGGSRPAPGLIVARSLGTRRSPGFANRPSRSRSRPAASSTARSTSATLPMPTRAPGDSPGSRRSRPQPRDRRLAPRWRLADDALGPCATTQARLLEKRQRR